MTYCAPNAVPYSAWLDWSDLDRAAAIAWQARDADRCPGCGLHHSDLDDIGGDRRRLPVDGEWRYCVGCEAKDLTRHPDEGAKDRRAWFHFRWRPRTASRPANGR